jgi:Iron-containing redox enzyme
MRLPRPRGPLSARVIAMLAEGRPAAAEVPDLADVVQDADAQLALWVLYELAYRGFEGVADELEWDPELLRLRARLEQAFEDEVRRSVRELVDSVRDVDDPGEQVLAMADRTGGVSLSTYLRREATREQVLDYLRERSIQQLKESDPQSFVLPRITGAAKVALAELQYDEYGAGDPTRLHQDLYARALRAAGLDPAYGAYIDDVSAVSLASANLMSLFCLNRRLVGAALGHFAAFEASSSVPSRRVAAGIERVGLGPEVAAYFHEHVEADAVHEQIAARDMCGAWVAEHPDRRDDVLLGAAAALHLDALGAEDVLSRWSSVEAEEMGAAS